MNLETVSSIASSALVLGSFYAIIATGLALTWTTLGIFDFAHGALIMVGAYMAWEVGNKAGLGLGPIVGLVVGVVALLALGLVLERLVVRPFLGSKNVVLVTVITTLAAMIFLQNGALLIWGPQMKQTTPVVTGSLGYMEFSFSGNEVAIIFAAPICLLALWVFLTNTRVGTALRAVSQNPEAALLVGVRASRMYSLAFGLSAALAGVAGALLGSSHFITPTMGLDPLLKALVVVIFGGLSTLAGTIGAAYIIGAIEAVSDYFLGLYWTPTLLFLVMIVVLIIKPNGLFGSEGA